MGIAVYRTLAYSVGTAERRNAASKERLTKRLAECGLEIHPEKTKIVYCKDDLRQEEQNTIEFDFLGYAFRPRRSYDKYGRLFTNFTPAISPRAAKALRSEVKSWHLQLMTDKTIEDLSRMFNPVITGWIGYYCRFYASAFDVVARNINRALVKWAMRKYQHLRGHKIRASEWIKELAKTRSSLFTHWERGFTGVAS